MMLLNIVAATAVFILILVGVGWLGLRYGVKRFERSELTANDLGTVTPPPNLPAPVARFLHAAFGDKIPVIESALVTGTAKLSFKGITFPARFKFYHDAGNAYYHYIQLLWFGRPIVTVNERYLDGTTILDLPGNRVKNDAKTDAAANQGLWAESIWLPSVWFTDARVRWEPVDDTTARLIVPNAAPEEVITVRFDPQTGLVANMTTLRYQNTNSTKRTLWTNRAFEWSRFNGVMIPTFSDLQWADDPPWAAWHVETVLYNIDVSARMAQFDGEFDD